MPDDAIAQVDADPRVVFEPGVISFSGGVGVPFFDRVGTQFANVDTGPEDSFLAGIAPRKRKRNAQKEFFH
jgi:hypothetical protein